jgi:hypothetical protein
MKLLDLLRKLGILSYGAKAGTYTSPKDRPVDMDIEADMTGGFGRSGGDDKTTTGGGGGF